MVLELNASDDRGINSVREEIKGFAEKLNLFKEGLKLIILDEVDAMTFDAQFALRFIMERYSATTRFCLICNYQNKIIPALRSRCACFRFAPIENTAITNILKNISKKEKIKFSDDIITSLCDISQGDIRKAINLLQTMSMHKKPSVELCYSLAATPNDKSMKKYVFEKKFEKIKELIANNGYSLHLVLECLNKYIQEFDITDKKLAKIISDLAVLEFRLNQSTFSDIYIINLVGIFMS
jgi:replication factor C subunit 3/5